jgi:hypothetical protein
VVVGEKENMETPTSSSIVFGRSTEQSGYLEVATPYIAVATTPRRSLNVSENQLCTMFSNMDVDGRTSEEPGNAYFNADSLINHYNTDIFILKSPRKARRRNRRGRRRNHRTAKVDEERTSRGHAQHHHHGVSQRIDARPQLDAKTLSKQLAEECNVPVHELNKALKGLMKRKPQHDAQKAVSKRSRQRNARRKARRRG